jgi:hypothetical protein
MYQIMSLCIETKGSISAYRFTQIILDIKFEIAIQLTVKM